MSQTITAYLGRAPITVTLVKGDLATEKADVIVCTTSRNLDLSKGRASNALLEVAGDIIQEECRDQYPGGMKSHEIAIVSGGKLPCTKVFFIALPVWGSGNRETEVLENVISMSLNKANEARYKSIVLPALGTGLLKYPIDMVAQTTLKTIEKFSNSNSSLSLKTITIAVFAKDTEVFKAFDTEINNRCKGSAMNKYIGGKSSLDVPVASIGLRTIIAKQKSTTERSIGDIFINIMSCDIIKLKADILVNITTPCLRLDETALSRSLLQIAGRQLQAECLKKYPTGIKPGDVVKTNGYNCNCQLIYHGTLTKWDGKGYATEKLLQKLVSNLLKNAESDKATSIGFPVLGLHELNFPVATSAKVLFQTIHKHTNSHPQSTITEVIVAVDPSANDCQDIISTYELELQKVLEGEVSDNEDLSGANILQYKLLELACHNSLERSVAPPRGTKEWFKYLCKSNVKAPSYWTVYNDKKTLKIWLLDADDPKPQRVPVNSMTFDLIKKLVADTWISKHVGQGRDALGLDGLKYKNIRVTSVERIENCDVFEKYAQKRQELFHRAAKQGAFLPLEHITGSSGKILTSSKIPLDTTLTADVYPEINEHYMFHGTHVDVVDTIVKQGLDCRLGGSAAMFGQGVYGAESSTKSDQYADPKLSRTSSEKKMFLIRMCLGKMFVINSAKAFVRPPCVHCLQDKCSCSDNNFFDSVVGDGSWNFREFVVYDRTQVYPEYLISYVRMTE